MKSEVHQIENRFFVRTAKLQILFEPWATQIEAIQGDEIVLQAYGTLTQNEVPRLDIWFVNDGITIETWGDALLNVYKNGVELPKVWY
jgi:hypothetical protein